MPDLMLMIVGPLFIVPVAGPLWLTWVAQLPTEVRNNGSYIRFYPVHRGFHGSLREEIESFEVRTYRPVLDSGGWGIRFGSGGKAHNVSGNRELQLGPRGRRSGHVLIRSQRPEELAMAVESASKKVPDRSTPMGAAFTIDALCRPPAAKRWVPRARSHTC